MQYDAHYRIMSRCFCVGVWEHGMLHLVVDRFAIHVRVTQPDVFIEALLRLTVCTSGGDIVTLSVFSKEQGRHHCIAGQVR